MAGPEVLRSIADLRQRVHEWADAGETVALVPTMGCLHEGHIKLVQRAEEVADRIITSIFVNPLQFSAGEDLDRYPRTLDADCDALAHTQCDVVFAPSNESLYPRGQDGLTEVHVPEVSSRHCGAFRPGHFEGVTTVVNILFNIVQPDVAIFGEKDCQQLFVIRRMVEDLHLPIQIIGVPTVREADGLAMSSRNRYLSDEQRKQAGHFPRVLDAVVAKLNEPGADVPAILLWAREELSAQGLHPQYVDLVSEGFCLADHLEPGQYHVLAAVEAGAARLIDNRSLRIAPS